jgi:hypothetical protein
VDKFEEMVSMVKRHNPSLLITTSANIKDTIQYHVQCHKPTSLSQAIWFAKRLEQSTPTYKRFTTFITPQQKDKKPEVKVPSAPSLAELRATGKCFKCREPWVPGHTKVCKGKQLYSVILMENDEGQEVAVIEDSAETDAKVIEDVPQIPVMQVSIHAVNETSHSTNTFVLKLQLGKHWATALVDIGSDASFVSAKFAVKANLKISLVKAATVVAANGKKMCSKTVCMDCSYNIQGYQFKSAFRLLELQGYDIILGADWICAHSPVGLNLRTREFSITKDGLDLITFVDETLPDRNAIISPKKLCKLLKKKVVGAVMVLTGGDNSDQMSLDAAVSPEISTLL